MLRRTFTTALIGAAALALPLAGSLPAASATTTSEQRADQSVRSTSATTQSTTSAATAAVSQAPAQTTTLYYDDSQAAEFQDDVAAAVEIWNSSVQNVQLAPAESGQRAEIEILATDGWPMATLGPVRPGGSATVWFGREAVLDGYDTVRIAAHELGHSLGLPDVKPGPCSSLMSGSTGGVDCTNAVPNEDEVAEVEANYGSGAAGQRAAVQTLIVDAPLGDSLDHRLAPTP